MDAAFVLAIAKRPGVPLARRVPSPGPLSDLGFEARHRLDWTDPGGMLHLVGWHAEAERGAGAWCEGNGGIAFLAGHLRWRGEDWEPSSGWADHLERAAPARSLDELHDALRGVFLAGQVTSAGDGWVITDVLGLRCLYWGEDDEVAVLSSRAALVAHALSPASPPRRDAEASCWLSFTGFHLGDRTGYLDVRVVPPGARLRLRGGTPTWEHTHPLIVSADDELRGHTVAELAEVVQQDVAESLRAALSVPCRRHVIRLTGGKDSRLLLAVAVRAGLADAFIYETVGPPDLADVQIAASLCEDLELRHETAFLGLGSPEPFAARFRRFVDSTACMTSGWDLNPPTGSSDLALTGLCGETLRRYVRLHEAQLADATLQRAFPRRAYGRLGLLRGGLGDDLHRQMLDILATEPHPAADPRDRVHALFAGGRTRFTRFGPREELAGDQRTQPLYSRTTLRAAMAMDPSDRTAELLFAEVMRQAAAVLVEQPFTDRGWDERAQAYLEGTGGGLRLRTDRQAAAPAAGGAGSHAPSLMASVYAAGSNERTDLLREVFSDTENPAWRVLDRAVALDALDRYSTLTNPERHELFGAATAAAWLAS